MTSVCVTANPTVAVAFVVDGSVAGGFSAVALLMGRLQAERINAKVSNK
jgi:hypothetical protein